MSIGGAHPILSCAEAGLFEQKRFGADERKEWLAMQQAGAAVAAAVWCDFEEIGGFPAGGAVLVLAGKGHNGGDALLAARELLLRTPGATVDVVLIYGMKGLRPLALRAWQLLQQEFPTRVRPATRRTLRPRYALSLDGIFGFNYRPPLDARAKTVLAAANRLEVQLRAAVDLPSGWGEPGAFRADFTYATGMVKTPLLELPNAGRLRYLDLGFFPAWVQASTLVLTADVLAPLRAWRDPRADKRKLGHVFVLGGSRNYPGAVLMTVLAALKSGAGLVSAFVPESLTPAFAAQVPEAMWIGWPETPDGGLALEGRHLLIERWSRASALVIGPGLGREKETVALVQDIVRTAKVPVVLDADALQPEIVQAARTALVLTPHAGEFERLADGRDLGGYVALTKATTVLKGPVTRIAAWERKAGGKVRASGKAVRVYHSFFGGPVLARGGSGDLLAGIIGTQLAQTPGDPLAAACRGVVWHGCAAEALARVHGAAAVRTTQVLDYLGTALRRA